MKNSIVKTSIFMKVQETYGLEKLELNKAEVTGWLSHGKASNICLDCYEPLLVSLEEIDNTVTILWYSYILMFEDPLNMPECRLCVLM